MHTRSLGQPKDFYPYGHKKTVASTCMALAEVCDCGVYSIGRHDDQAQLLRILHPFTSTSSPRHVDCQATNAHTLHLHY